MKIKFLACGFASFLGAAASYGEAPAVTAVDMSDNGDGTVKIEYALDNPPAVVTLDIVDGDGNSIGEKKLLNVGGDVNCKVSLSDGVIRWTPPAGFVAGAYKAKVTAHPMDDTPDIMVVDLAREDGGNRVKYYISTNSLPGGLLENAAYRTTHLVFKKVRAKGVRWMMGATSADGYYDGSFMSQHEVTLNRNYYMALFPLTCSQIKCIQGSYAASEFTLDRDMRIQDRIWWHLYTIGRGTDYPNAPSENSILGKLRAKVGNVIDFDFPTEAEWEFAARAGNGTGYWGDGKQVRMTSSYYAKDANLTGHYRGVLAVDWLANCDKENPWTKYAAQQGPTNAVPIAGSYPPNSWGFYDMQGGVWEWCLDWYQADITALKGAVNISLENPDKLADGETDGASKVVRGGGWDSWAYHCMPAYRKGQSKTYTGDQQATGIRVVCHMELR